MLKDESNQLMTKGSRLVAILLIAVVVAAGAGYWLLTPRIPNEPSSMVQQTSLLTPLERSRTSTEWTVLGSPTTGPYVTTQTLWINVSASHPVSYYLALLKSTQAQPYVQLAWELQSLPDARNATAVAKITWLALNATNPEVKEAFQLMMKGGTPSPSDFQYTVPNYNTELQVLYWLACQNEFKKDDTLALAIAMVNGLWVTVGYQQVRDAVRSDASSMLNFGREISEWQRSVGLLYDLEDYPLEAKICWSWTGNVTPIFGPFGLSDNLNSQNFLGKRLPFEGYLWNTVSAGTLSKMKSMMSLNGAMLPSLIMLDKDAGATVHNLEYYFYFMNPRPQGSSEHWDYADPKYPDSVKDVVLDGKMVQNWFIFNVDAMFDQQYMRTGKLSGGCMDETAWVDSWAKSVGISTTALWHVGWDQDRRFNRYNHVFNVFYDPVAATWKADDLHLRIGLGETYQLTHIFVPPVNQHDYLRTKYVGGGMGLTGNFFYDLHDLSEETIRNMFLTGVAAAQMKQWLLYS